jgi:hypothetical protein
VIFTGQALVMLRRLGLVALLCLASAACTPGAYKGRVIAGLDDEGALVAVLGVCDPGTLVKLRVNVPDPDQTHDTRTVAEAELDGATEGMRVVLLRDEAPDGWSSDMWSLPEQGIILVRAATEQAGGGQPVQYLDDTEINLAAVPPLPGDAEDRAVEDC